MKRCYCFLLTGLIVFAANTHAFFIVAGGHHTSGRNPLNIGIVLVSVAVDAGNNIVIAVPLKHLVRKLTPPGVCSIAAGAGIYGGGGNAGPPLQPG